MPRVNETKQKNQNKNQKMVTKKDKTDYKIIKIAGVALLSVVVLFLGYLLLDKYVLNSNNNQTVERFKDVDHLTLNQYKWLLNDDEKEPVEGVLYDVYVFVYNKDYDACTLCGTLESDVKAAAAAAEAKGYSFYVLDYQKYQDIATYVTGTFLPNRPALIHISGEAYADTDAISTSENAILSILSTITK